MDIDYNEKDWATPCPKYDYKKTACKCGLEYVNIPTSLGDDSEGSKVAPKNGAYCNALVVYEANGHVYIYSKEGIPTLIDVDASDISVLEQEVIKAQKDVHELREDIDDSIYGFDTVADMQAATNLIDGSYAKTLGFHNRNDGGGATYKIKTHESETINGFNIIQLDDNTLIAILCVENDVNPKQFGAWGDDTYDDSDALQAYIDYGTTDMNVRLNTIKATYKISKTLDLNGKGIVGNGFSIHEDIDKGGLHFVLGTYVDAAMINVGNQISDILIKGEANINTDAIHMDSSYNTVIQNVGINGFVNQIVVEEISVAFRVTNFSATNWSGYSIYVKDIDNEQSTTSWFNNCLFYHGSGEAIKFLKELYCSSFTNIILERTNGGISAALFYYCNFSNIYTENTLDDQARPWLYWTTSQQCSNNTYDAEYIKSPWTDPTAVAYENAPNNAGGVSIHNSKVNARGSTGRGVVLDQEGIHTNHAAWLAAAYRPLVITTQPRGTESNYITPIHIKAPNGQLYLKNQGDVTTAVTVKRVVGGDNNGDEVLGTDVYDFREKSWSHTYPATNSTNTFSALMLFNYDQNHLSPTNGSWTLSREDVGTFLLSRSADSTQLLNNPSILVSGAVVSTVNGDGTPLVHGVQLINSYSGEYAAYSTCKEVRIKFYNLSGTLTDPTKFTLAITQK